MSEDKALREIAERLAARASQVLADELGYKERRWVDCAHEIRDEIEKRFSNDAGLRDLVAARDRLREKTKQYREQLEDGYAALIGEMNAMRSRNRALRAQVETLEQYALQFCPACGGQGYHVEPGHDGRCDGEHCGHFGCPVPTQIQCDCRGALAAALTASAAPSEGGGS